MNLRRKTLFILGLTLIVAIVVILCLSYTVLIGSYSSFEEKTTNASVIEVLKAITYEISLIEKSCGDWSRWDETYQFVIDGNPEYVHRNLNPDTVNNLGIDLFLFVNKSRGLVYATQYNSSTRKNVPMSDADIQTILSTDLLFSHDQPVSSSSGILSLSDVPVMIISQPVLKSTYEGPSVGYLIFGKKINQEEILTLSEITSLNFTLISTPSFSHQISKQESLTKGIIPHSDNSAIIVQRISSESIIGYTTISDLAGNNSFIIQVTGNRDIYNQGLATIGSFIAIVVLISLLFIAIALLSIDHLVMKRLAVLIDRTRSRESVFSVDEDPLLRNGDELSELARALTPVFDHIARSEEELRESEERYRNVVESQTEFICRFTPEGRHIFANQAYCRYFGKTQDELLYGSFLAKTHPDDVKKLKEHFSTLTSETPVATIEHRVIMPSGETKWQQWTDLAFYDSAGSVTEYQSVGRDISERKQNEEDLERVNQDLNLALLQLTISEKNLKNTLRISEESERKYRELADSLPEFVFEVDTYGKFKFLNQLGFQVSGYQPEDLEAGLDVTILVAPEDRSRLIARMGRVMAGEKISGQEYTGYRRDETRFPIVMYSIPVKKDGVVSGLRGFAIDITERKQMEASNRKLADIVQHTKAGIMTGSHDIIDVVNPAYALMHGYSPEDIADIPPFSLFSPELQKVFPEYLMRAEREGHVVFEADHMHQNGERIPTLNDLTVISDPEGIVRWWILNVQDITSHRLAWKILMESESLRESHRQLNDVISRLPDATFVIDKDGWVILWNAAMEQLTGISSEDIIGRGQSEYAIPFYGTKRPLLIDLVLDHSLDPVQFFSDITHNGETLAVEEYLSDTVNGPMYLSSVANPIFDARGRIIGAIESIRDISSRKMVEKALLKTNEKLNLLSSITRHDIRNRITVLFGILPLVKRMSTNPDMLEMVNMLEKAAYAIRDQIEFTRDYQDMGVHAPEWKDAGELLDLISHQGLLTHVRLENELHGLIVLADPLLERVFYNLIDNAIRHGGNISLIAASYAPDNHGVVIIFEDNGAGIPVILKEKIFERGYGKNTGLGLFLVREILSITGIMINETGIHGEGARFEMHVPDGCYRLE